jgi:hypothetical protein
MRACSGLILVLALAGCGATRASQGRSCNDVWVIGEVLSNHTEQVTPAKAKLMGQSLKSIADTWAEELDVELTKECEACR